MKNNLRDYLSSTNFIKKLKITFFSEIEEKENATEIKAYSILNDIEDLEAILKKYPELNKHNEVMCYFDFSGQKTPQYFTTIILTIKNSQEYDTRGSTPVQNLTYLRDYDLQLSLIDSRKIVSTNAIVMEILKKYLTTTALSIYVNSISEMDFTSSMNHKGSEFVEYNLEFSTPYTKFGFSEEYFLEVMNHESIINDQLISQLNCGNCYIKQFVWDIKENILRLSVCLKFEDVYEFEFG